MRTLREVRETTSKLFDIFLSNIPPCLQELAREEIYVSGGVIRSIMLDENINDVDLWFKSDKMIASIKALKLGFTSQNAVSFYVNSIQFQLIFCQVQSPEDLIAEFDFTMNQNYYDPSTNILVVKDQEAVLEKQLVITNDCRNPLGTLARIHKFTVRGYKVPSRTDLLRLGVLISKTPINTFKELEDNSKLYFSEEQFDEVDFVTKPENAPPPLFERAYTRTRSGSCGGGDYL